MSDTEIRTLSTSYWDMEVCPVLEMYEEEVIPCGEPLVVIATMNTVGDDFGSWQTYSVEFECGHTFDQMVRSMEKGEYI